MTIKESTIRTRLAVFNTRILLMGTPMHKTIHPRPPKKMLHPKMLSDLRLGVTLRMRRFPASESGVLLLKGEAPRFDTPPPPE